MQRKTRYAPKTFVSYAAEDSTTFDRANDYFLMLIKFSLTFVVAVRGNERTCVIRRLLWRGACRHNEDEGNRVRTDGSFLFSGRRPDGDDHARRAHLGLRRAHPLDLDPSGSRRRPRAHAHRALRGDDEDAGGGGRRTLRGAPLVPLQPARQAHDAHAPPPALHARRELVEL